MTLTENRNIELLTPLLKYLTLPDSRTWQSGITTGEIVTLSPKVVPPRAEKSTGMAVQPLRRLTKPLVKSVCVFFVRRQRRATHAFNARFLCLALIFAAVSDMDAPLFMGSGTAPHHSWGVYVVCRLATPDSFVSSVLREINNFINCCSSFIRTLYHLRSD